MTRNTGVPCHRKGMEKMFQTMQERVEREFEAHGRGSLATGQSREDYIADLQKAAEWLQAALERVKKS